MLHKLNQLTSFQGRINRTTYWKYIAVVIGISLLEMLLQMAVVSGMEPGKSLLMAHTIISGLALIPILIILFSALVRRLHDINLSGYWALGYLALTYFWPIALAAIVMLGCLPSKPGKNKYDVK